jgi:hypothetical protein
MMKEKTIVLSMDAMVGADIAYLKTKPNFSRLFKERCEVGKVCTIYPSITYPAHMSIMTGCRPGKHGVITNLQSAVDKGYPAWHIDSSILQVEDIFAAAKRQGMTTGSIYWPICGNNPNIDYLINEFFFYENEPVEEAFAAMGANEATLEIVRENMHRFPTAFEQVEERLELNNSFDDFIMGCMCSMIRKNSPTCCWSTTAGSTICATATACSTSSSPTVWTRPTSGWVRSSPLWKMPVRTKIPTSSSSATTARWITPAASRSTCCCAAAASSMWMKTERSPTGVLWPSPTACPPPSS